MSLDVFDLFDHHQSDQIDRKHNFNSFLPKYYYFFPYWFVAVQTRPIHATSFPGLHFSEWCGSGGRNSSLVPRVLSLRIRRVAAGHVSARFFRFQRCD